MHNNEELINIRKKELLNIPLDKCAFCGSVFLETEIKIIKKIYGYEWAFCSENCLDNFLKESNYYESEFDETDKDED